MEEKEDSRTYYQRHRGELREKAKAYYQEHIKEKKEYYQEHRKERIAYSKEYRKENKEKLKKQQRNRRKKLKKNPPYKQAGYFLREALADLNESQSWLAEQLGVSRERVSNYLRGIYLPKDADVRKELCRILNRKKKDLESLIEK